MESTEHITDIDEETTAADIAPVDTKLNLKANYTFDFVVNSEDEEE